MVKKTQARESKVLPEHEAFLDRVQVSNIKNQLPMDKTSMSQYYNDMKIIYEILSYLR